MNQRIAIAKRRAALRKRPSRLSSNRGTAKHRAKQ